MKRIVIAISAIFGAFIISFTGYFLVDKTCERLENHLWEICAVSQKQEIEKAVKMSDDAVSLWEEAHGLVESFIRHEETDKLEELIKSLPVYAQQGNMERLEQQADLAIDEIHHLIRSEKPLISNIF
jgi:thioredoxin-like negative regulator of GroEL